MSKLVLLSFSVCARAVHNTVLWTMRAVGSWCRDEIRAIGCMIRVGSDRAVHDSPIRIATFRLVVKEYWVRVLNMEEEKTKSDCYVNHNAKLKSWNLNAWICASPLWFVTKLIKKSYGDEVWMLYNTTFFIHINGIQGKHYELMHLKSSNYMVAGWQLKKSWV